MINLLFLDLKTLILLTSRDAKSFSNLCQVNKGWAQIGLSSYIQDKAKHQYSRKIIKTTTPLYDCEKYIKFTEQIGLESTNIYAKLCRFFLQPYPIYEYYELPNGKKHGKYIEYYASDMMYSVDIFITSMQMIYNMHKGDVSSIQQRAFAHTAPDILDFSNIKSWLTHPNAIKRIIMYNNGKKHGYKKEFKISGKIRYHNIYEHDKLIDAKDIDNKKVIILSRYNNGSIKSIYRHLIADKKSGKHIKYKRNGKIFNYTSYKDGESNKLDNMVNTLQELGNILSGE